MTTCDLHLLRRWNMLLSILRTVSFSDAATTRASCRNC